VNEHVGMRLGNGRFTIGAAMLSMALVVAACGGAGAAAGTVSGGGATAASGGGATTAPVGSAGGASGGLDVCQVVTQADVAPFFTSPMTAESDTSLSGETSGCVYQVSPHDGLPPMQIQAVVGDQAAGAYAAFTGGNEGALALSGIGDHAVRSPGSASFAAIKGSTFCTVELGSGNNAHYAGLPTADADGNLPDAGAEAYALRLGALCAKIFAAAGS
jgi:hypothetical protein